jgi:xanthine phosphoribosyltransferase
MGEPIKIYFTWRQVEIQCTSLKPLIDDWGIKTIVGVSRGGLPAAAMLGHICGIKDVQSVTVQSYPDGTVNAGQLKFTSNSPLLLASRAAMFIDDIADSGNTMAFLAQKFPHVKRVALVAKPEALRTLDATVDMAEPDTWIVFPWENIKENPGRIQQPGSA